MASKKKMKYTKEELAAMKVRAMLQGIDPSTITNEILDSDEDDIDIEIENEKPRKRRKASDKESSINTVVEIEELEQFSCLKRNLVIPINFLRHDIPYKEQLWGVPERVVNYNIEIVKNPKIARDISNKMNGNSVEEAEKATKGLVRYFKIITYDTVPFKAKEIGYIKVFVDNNNKIKTKVKISKTQMKENNINFDKAKSSIQKAIKELKA